MDILEEASAIVDSLWSDDAEGEPLEVMKPDDSLWSSLAFWCLVAAIAGVFGAACALVMRFVL